MTNRALRVSREAVERRSQVRMEAVERQASFVVTRRPGNEAIVDFQGHVTAVDPHPQYLTAAEGDAAYDMLGAATNAVAVHEAAADPHAGYLKESDAVVTYLPISLPGTATPSNNSDMTFELTSDTTLTVKVKGTDGTVRSAVLVLT